MEQTIREMILQADDERNLDLICCVKEILDEFSSTHNCPLDWRHIGAVLADEYPAGSWVYENLNYPILQKPQKHCKKQAFINRMERRCNGGKEDILQGQI